MRDTLLLPPRGRFAGVALPAPVARALGRARQATLDPPGAEAAAGVFEVLPRGWPAAAATRQRDCGDAAGSLWLRADPAHVRPDINGARLLGYGPALGLTAEDVEALLPALRPLFGDAGYALDAPAPTRWYLRLPAGTRLPRFVAPETALGEDLFDHLPGADDTGPEARRWRALLSEAQVVLHNHPHNRRRLDGGRVAVNSLWFWGGGALPQTVRSVHAAIHTDDEVLDAFARLARTPVSPLPERWSAGSGGRLFDLRARRDAEALLRDWIAPLADSRMPAELRFADGAAFVLDPAQRWRFWRAPLWTLA